MTLYVSIQSQIQIRKRGEFSEYRFSKCTLNGIRVEYIKYRDNENPEIVNETRVKDRNISRKVFDLSILFYLSFY